jgi:chromosome segregation ATPase
MAELSKNDLKNIKEVFTEALEPFAKAVQKDFDGLKSEVGLVKSEVGLVKFELNEVKKDIKWMKDNSGELFAKLDELITLFKNQRQELAILQTQVKRLEERIVKLESGTR